MTSRVLLRPSARRDLEEIWDHTRIRWGMRQAETYVRQIEEATRTLADNPEIGPACDEIRAGYRKFPVGSHVLFYRGLGDGIEIVRILHERMDAGRRLD